MKAPPVTAEYVMGLYQHARSDSAERGLRSFIREVRLLFDMAYPVRIPKEYRAITKEVRTPVLRDTALRVTASLTKDEPIMTNAPRDDDVDSLRAASIAGRWTMEIFRDMDHHMPEKVGYQSALHLVRDSESVVKTVYRPDAWANFPGREKGESAKKYTERSERHRRGGIVAPFASRCVDRMQMVFGDGEYGDEWAIEYGEYPLPYLDRRYSQAEMEEITPAMRLGGPPTGDENYQLDTKVPAFGRGGPGGTTLKLEYFDQESWAVVINGVMAPGFPKANPFAPLLPYARVATYPILYPLRYLVPALDALLTMKMNWSYLAAFPIVIMEPVGQLQQMLATLPVGDQGDPPENMTWQPGKIYFPPPGYTMRMLEPPTTGADLNQMIEQVRELIDIAGIPNVFRGIGGSRQAGYSINQLMAAAQLTYKQAGEALEAQRERQARLLYHMIEGPIGQTVYVLGEGSEGNQWLGLRPTGDVLESVAPVDRIGPPRCTFRPVLPTDEQAQAMIGLEVTNAARPLTSVRYAMEHYLNIADPVAMMDEIAVEQALAAPPIQELMLTEALREEGIAARPAAPPGIVGSPQPAPEGEANGRVQPNDAANAGAPSIIGLNQPEPRTGAMRERTGGREAGMFPGREGR